MAVHYNQSADWNWYARQVLLWNWVSWIFNFIDRGLIGPLLPLMIPFFHLSLTAAGGIVSLFFVGYLSTFVGGLLSDRVGRKKVVGRSVVGFGAVTGLTALASSVPFLAAVRIGTGVFEGFQYPTGAAWVSETFPYAKRGKALAFWETGYSLGTLLGIVMATLLAARWGWQSPWPVSGGLSVLCGVLLIKYVKERPRKETPGYQEAVAMSGGVVPTIKDVWRKRNVWVVFILHGLYNFTFWMAGAWIPEYVIHVRHMSFVSGGLLSAVLFGGITVGLMVSGIAADRIGRVKAISFLSFGSALLLLAFTQASSPTALFVLIALGGIFGAYIPTAIALVTDTTNPMVSGTAFGIALFGAELGAVLGPVTGGFLAQHYGFQTAMYVLPASLFAASLLVWLARDARRDLKVEGVARDAVHA